jgi:hypothetical protein
LMPMCPVAGWKIIKDGEEEEDTDSDEDDW